MFLRYSLVLLAIIALLAYPAVLEEFRFTYRTYRYVFLESGWVIEVTVAFWEPLVAGRSATVDLAFEVKESRQGTLISITSARISTGNVSVSSYIGLFRGAGERRSASLAIELSEPRYSKLNPGDSRIEFLTLAIEGYVGNATSRTLFMKEYRIPVLVVAPAGSLKVSVEIPWSLRVGSDASMAVVVSNRGSNTIYNVEVKVYVNSSLLDVAYYPVIEPSSSKVHVVNFKARSVGLHIVTVNCRYLTQEYGLQSLTYQSMFYVKSQHSIAITLTSAGGATRIIGLVSPPVDTRVYVEASLDGVRWVPVANTTPGSDGLFEVTIKDVKGDIVMLRARIPETDTTFESISNVVALANTTKVEAKTITVTTTQTQFITVTRTMQPQPQTPLTPITTATETAPSGTPTLQVIVIVLALSFLLASMLLFLFRRR